MQTAIEKALAEYARDTYGPDLNLMFAHVRRSVAAHLVEALAADPNAVMPGFASTHAPETTHEAAHRKEFTIAWGNDRTKLLNDLHERAVEAKNALFPQHQHARDFGYTAAALADRRGWSRNQTAARLLELRTMGLVEYRPDEDGRPITAWTNAQGTATGRVQFITEAGEAAVRRARAEAS